MASDKKRDYGVGYGKPPRHTRFTKGQSGNPKGRPPETNNLSSLLYQELNQRVVVAADGKRQAITKWRAFIKQLVDRAAAGDLRAGKLILELYSGTKSRADTTSAQPADFTDADLKVIEQLKAQLPGKKRESDD
jgi:predicted DNA-binding ribbon-helix-helix protein